jgi:hypothetical protein
LSRTVVPGNLAQKKGLTRIRMGNTARTMSMSSRSDTPHELRLRLDGLYAELAAARETDLVYDGSYMRDLRSELDEVHAAWAMATIMERVLERARIIGTFQG